MTKNTQTHSKHLWIALNQWSYAIRSPNPIYDDHTITYPKRRSNELLPEEDIIFSQKTAKFREGMWGLSKIIIEQLQHLSPQRCQIYFDIEKNRTHPNNLYMNALTG